MPARHDIHACKFRDPRGNILVAAHGVGEDNYMFKKVTVKWVWKYKRGSFYLRFWNLKSLSDRFCFVRFLVKICLRRCSGSRREGASFLQKIILRRDPPLFPWLISTHFLYNARYTGYETVVVLSSGCWDTKDVDWNYQTLQWQ